MTVYRDNKFGDERVCSNGKIIRGGRVYGNGRAFEDEKVCGGGEVF